MKKRTYIHSFVFYLLLLTNCATMNRVAPFYTLPEDPLNAQIYTLKNGLKVYLTVNKDEPRIHTYIAVKAGSKFDPPQTTGLAHYLEHMLFKGTSKIGALDWGKEAPLLKQISDLYEKHKATNDLGEKASIYREIDSLSHQASSYVSTNEYDKLITAIGAKNTNAYTSNDKTVYINNIPSNELERWLQIESERFRELVLRLFHTELETVYEEYNMNQDNEGRWSFQNVLKGLFPNHPYGTQTTIGEGQHLKNPSMVNIHRYFDTYYVPNNMAICLSGDINPKETISLIEKYFGDFSAKEIPSFAFEAAPKIEYPIVMETWGPQAPHLYIGFRYPGASSKEVRMLKLIDLLLSNGQAGLIDLNLEQQQKILKGYSFPYINKDYSVHFLYGQPRENQSLEEVKDLLLSQIDTIKQGAFEDWLLEAVIHDYQLYLTKEFEKNENRAHHFVEAFTLGLDWGDVVGEINEMKKITKEDLIAFAQSMYADNYVVSYKRIGDDSSRLKVDKPDITPVKINRDTYSDFYKMIEEMPTQRNVPKFIDYQNDIKRVSLKDSTRVYAIENKDNDLFNLYYILDMGKSSDKYIALAVSYLKYLGTDRYSAQDIQKEFFRLGMNFEINVSHDRIYIHLSGLEAHIEEGIKLMNHILDNVEPNQIAYDQMVEGILKKRQNSKNNQRTILGQAMVSYAKYGARSPFTDILEEQTLRSVDIKELVRHIKNLKKYPYRIFYYGNKNTLTLKTLLDPYTLSSPKMNYSILMDYPELEMTDNNIYFTHYPEMVQAQILMLSKDQNTFDRNVLASVYLFNAYFGTGLSSIVFQEIREQKALAYSAYAYYRNPNKKDKAHYLQAFIGTQTDKIEQAISAMLHLLNHMPRATQQFEGAKESAIKQMETDWVTKENIFWHYDKALQRGLTRDIRKDMYKQIQSMTIDDLQRFFDEHIKGKKFTFLVLGDREKINLSSLKKWGKYEELDLETLFGY